MNVTLGGDFDDREQPRWVLIESLDKLGEKSEGGDDARLEIDHPASEGGGGGGRGIHELVRETHSHEVPGHLGLKGNQFIIPLLLFSQGKEGSPRGRRYTPCTTLLGPQLAPEASPALAHGWP